MATEEVIIDVPGVEGVRVRQEPTVQKDVTVWRIEQGEAGIYTPLATVMLKHPEIARYGYSHNQNPIEDEQITLTLTGRTTWSSSRPTITWKAAMGVAVAMQEAGSKALDIRKGLEPQVADRLKEIEERERKRKEYNEKSNAIQDKIREITASWVAETTEALKWYEGQAGRLKRKNKKGWDTFHQLGAVNGNHIYWNWSGQRFSDSLTEVQKVEIRYESERTFEKVDLPKYPEEEITKLRTEMGSLERAW